MTNLSATLSRRDFLKLAGLGLAGAFLPGLSPKAAVNGLYPDQEGRVAEKSISVYDSISFEGERVNTYWRDLILPITGIYVSDDENAYNRIWYRIGDEGYAYSGGIQPVRTVLHDPVFDLPPEGALAEVTVPYTDARREAKSDAQIAYRLYYKTTHWVERTISNLVDEQVWYRLADDKWKDEYYYAPASHLRILPEEELTPISPDVPNYRKSIEVRLSQQLVVAYEGSTPVFATRAATGAQFSTGRYYTPKGEFITYHKRPSRHMAAGNLAANGYDLPGVPWVMYITESGISFHGTYWHNDFGRPRSHGCINLSMQAAKWLFRWTTPVVPPDQQYVYGFSGTYVEIVE
ncbi:MAG: L,D-transpeptidase family protein [Chloroflexi bacterium]|nr:L,D-transpeptidase family protein [Chloroflexota bacterium]